jgi:nucleotide-binding universal stress UspA family protein
MTTHAREQHHPVVTNPSLVPDGAVVVGVDATLTDIVLDWAIDHARAQGRPLVLAHASGPAWAERTVLDAEQLRDKLVKVGEDALEHGYERARRRAGDDVRIERFVGIEDAAELLVGLSRRASLVVVGSHGRGPVGRLLLGSVGVVVAERAACPVAVHRPRRVGVVRQGVLVGIGATAHSRSTLEVAFRLASSHRLPLTIVHSRSELEATATGPHLVSGDALQDVDEERLQVAETIAGLREDHPDVHTTVHLARGRPDQALTSLAGRMDLLVVGRHDGRRGQLVGGTAISILEHSSCSVVVVPEVPTAP